MTGPLTGIRVVEFAGLAPAPFAAMMLADHGAEVTRIDRPGVEANSLDLLSRSRRILPLNLKNSSDRAEALALIDRADVLIEGFRPGVMERLGLGPDECLARNPRLVYGRMTGWGQDGPLSHAAGHDINYIALSGALGAMGPAGAPPVPPLNMVGDFGGGGLMLAFGLLAALVERNISGEGQVVDAAMVDGAAVLTTHLHQLRHEGIFTEDRGRNLLDGGAPFYRTYRAADGGYLAVGAIEPQFYALLLEGLELDHDELPEQMDQSSWQKLHDVFAERFASADRAHWGQIFDGSDACVSEVLDASEISSHPHLRERNVLVEVGGVTQPAPAPRFSRTRSELPRAATAITVDDLMMEGGRS